MSAFAADELCGPEDSVVHELWSHSYNTGHLVFYTARAGMAQPLRVLVDRHSADQQLLTALEFAGDGVTMHAGDDGADPQDACAMDGVTLPSGPRTRCS